MDELELLKSSKDLHHPFFISQVTHSKLELTSFMHQEPSRTANTQKNHVFVTSELKSLSMPTEKSLFRFQLNLTRLKKLQNCFQREEEHILADCVLISILGASEYPQWKEQLFSMFKVNYLLKLLSNSEMSFITRKDLLLLNSKYRRQNFQISL